MGIFSLLYKVVLAQISEDSMTEHHKILIVGGGSGGIAVASQLTRNLPKKDQDIAIVEPQSKHYYQPLWTMVGGGIFKKQDSEGNEEDYIPKGSKWLKTSITEFNPEENSVKTKNGKKITYDYMVVATGIELYMDKIKGFKESVGKNGVCTNYSYNYVDSTWEFLKDFKEGTLVFTVPENPIKCGGAPQKIMWLADDYLRKQGKRDKCKIIFMTATPTMFGVKKYSDILEELRKERGVDAMFKTSLVEIKSDSKEAIFKTDNGTESSLKYDFLHVTPPMGPSIEIRNSPLSSPNGYVDVDKYTLQHNKFKNIFSLGDCANLPTSKTVAAITKQAPTVVANILSCLKNEPLNAHYNGYTSCPILTGYNSKNSQFNIIIFRNYFSRIFI